MAANKTTSFRDFYNDDSNVSTAERAKIEFEVELIGKLIEANNDGAVHRERLRKNTRNGLEK